MCIDLLTNPAVIGGLVGAIASAVFALVTSWYKFNKRKKGSLSLIQSEIFYTIEVLKNFKDKYLKEEIILEDENKMNNELFNFYNKMANFPILTNRNWLNLISFIPDIFSEIEINKINKFYIKCDEVSDAADALSKTSNVTSWEVQGEEPTYVPVPQEDINSHRNMFRKDLNELIKLGEEVKEIFE